MLNKNSVSLVHRLSSGSHQNPWNLAIDFSRVQMWKPTVSCANVPLHQSCGISASTEEYKSHVEYAENTTKMKDMYVKDTQERQPSC